MPRPCARGLPLLGLLALSRRQSSGIAERAYVERPDAWEQAETIDTVIRIAIDDQQKRVVFDRSQQMKGKNAALIIALAVPFRQAMHEERAPENYPFTETSKLMRQINCDSQETFRKTVLRCRNKLTLLATRAGDCRPSIDAVIESSQWHGYRLNPSRVRIVALSEVLAGP